MAKTTILIRFYKNVKRILDEKDIAILLPTYLQYYRI